MPKAVVATMTSAASDMNASWTRVRSAGGHSGVVRDSVRALLDERGGQILRVLAGRRVDDARLGASTTRAISAWRLSSSSAKPSTARRMFGRSKPRTTIARLAHAQPLDDLLPHRRRCGRGQRQDTRMCREPRSTAPRRRYSGRKSCPHSLMQWASSTTKREGLLACTRANVSSFANCSGARKRNSVAPCCELVECVLSLGSGQGRIDQGGPAHVHLGNRLDLVALKGNQWRDNDRSPGNQ